MRGIFRPVPGYPRLHRFNPAYAGNMGFYSDNYCFRQVQPRVCGEYIFSTRSFVSYEGSTPRMRGIWMPLEIRRITIRFNPAYAGNICSGLAGCSGSWVQPRVCGEYFSLSVACNVMGGSTPRMRGILCRIACCILPNGFNPAYAGNIEQNI